MARSIRVRHSVIVAAPPAEVFEFTQDYSRRATWDPAVLEATVLDSSPLPRVRVRGRGGLRCVFEYKLFDPPRRTSLTMTEVRSPWIEAGGGSWRYEQCAQGTRWTQSVGITLRAGIGPALLAPAFRWTLVRSLERSMRSVARRFATEPPRA